MSEPLDRARRVVAIGAAALAIVLVALAAAAWKLVEVETADAAVRGRSAAALAVDDLVRAWVEDARDDDALTSFAVTTDGQIEGAGACPPLRFAAMPPASDAQAAFYLRESESWSPSLRRAALRRAVKSADVATRIAAKAAGTRLELREGTGRAGDWANERGEVDDLAYTRDGVLLALACPGLPSEIGGAVRIVSLGYGDSWIGPALDIVGGDDDVEVRAMLAALVPDRAQDVQGRIRGLAAVHELLPVFRDAPEVAGRHRAALLPTGEAMTAVFGHGRWTIRRMPGARVQMLARHVLAPRGLSLVHGDAGSLPVAVPFPGADGWAIAASFSESESRSRATLLLSGLGVAATAAVLAFAAFARAVRRDARLATLRTEFVATVSHELRTPVAIVRTSAETLAAGRATTDADRLALTSAIVRESERLSDLVGNVLDFARMEAGRRTYQFRDADVGALLRDVASRHAGVTVDVAGDLPRLRLDTDALAAAVGNLLDNARKFSPPGADVTLRALSAAGGVSVEVEDHGIGVPDAEKEQVFERFFRGSDPRVRETRGAGIGLALVQHAAEAHGGRVEIVDTPGGGATFRIVLPLVQNGDR